MSNGLLHFYKKGDKLHYVGADEYEAQKESLPDLCFAIKCQIADIESKEWPDLEALARDFVDYENTSNDQKVDCNVNGKNITGPKYLSFSKINGDNQVLNISEKNVFVPSQYDINPLIYYRIARPLKQGAKLPLIDLKNYYKGSSAYGVDLTVEHDVEYLQNDRILELTKATYDELCETITKFSPEFDSELLREMDRYIKSSLIDKEITQIDVKKDFKIADMTFKNPKLKKLSESVKRKRIELYLTFNVFFLELMPFISL